MKRRWALSWSPEELQQDWTTDPTLGDILVWMKQEKQRLPNDIHSEKPSVASYPADHVAWVRG